MSLNVEQKALLKEDSTKDYDDHSKKKDKQSWKRERRNKFGVIKFFLHLFWTGFAFCNYVLSAMLKTCSLFLFAVLLHVSLGIHCMSLRYHFVAWIRMHTLHSVDLTLDEAPWLPKICDLVESRMSLLQVVSVVANWFILIMITSKIGKRLFRWMWGVIKILCVWIALIPVVRRFIKAARRIQRLLPSMPLLKRIWEICFDMCKSFVAGFLRQ
jgi:hypothetical protein